MTFEHPCYLLSHQGDILTTWSYFHLLHLCLGISILPAIGNRHPQDTRM